jgi:hypothetical protein
MWLCRRETGFTNHFPNNSDYHEKIVLFNFIAGKVRGASLPVAFYVLFRHIINNIPATNFDFFSQTRKRPRASLSGGRCAACRSRRRKYAKPPPQAQRNK